MLLAKGFPASTFSGYDIAEDAIGPRPPRSCRPKGAATSHVGRAPARPRGRDTVAWLVEYGFFDHRPQDLTDPTTVHRP